MDPHSEDRSNASHWRKDLVECGSSGTGDPSALVKQRLYNLRPRKDEPVKLQRRLALARSEKLKTERRIKHKEAEALRQKKLREQHSELLSGLKEILDRMPEPEEPDLANRTEIINSDTSGVMEMEKWRPYFESPTLGQRKTTLKGVCWKVEELALQVAPSVVGLQSLTDGNMHHFFCSGTIVESSGEFHKIVTVANLVKKCPDTDELAKGLMITVYLQNHETCGGHLLYHDFFYNICVIEIQCPLNLPKQGFTSNIKAINFDQSWSRDVVTLGRDRETHALVVTIGKIIPKCSSFECEELLVSTCRISKAEVGGPLMNFDGNFIGLNYYQHKETPFIPSFIVLKCLQQLKLFGKVIRPWHGMRVRTLFIEGCNSFEKMQTNLLGTTGVIIEKIEDQSSAKASGLSEGDIINRVNGLYFSNAAELGGILLDIYTEQNNKQLYGSDKMVVCFKFGVAGCQGERTVIVDKLASSGANRWPFPKPIIIQKYKKGKKILEEWYAMESLEVQEHQLTSVSKRNACI